MVLVGLTVSRAICPSRAATASAIPTRSARSVVEAVAEASGSTASDRTPVPAAGTIVDALAATGPPSTRAPAT